MGDAPGTYVLKAEALRQIGSRVHRAGNERTDSAEAGSPTSSAGRRRDQRSTPRAWRSVGTRRSYDAGADAILKRILARLHAPAPVLPNGLALVMTASEGSELGGDGNGVWWRT
jgi:hypothetical protein